MFFATTARIHRPIDNKSMTGLIVLAAAMALLAACARGAEPTTVAPATAEPTPITEEQVTPDDDNLLVWQGALEDGSCGQVTVDAGGNGGINPCNDTATINAWLPIHQTEWELVYNHFGELSYSGADESLMLQGAGVVANDVWAEAVSVWARYVYQEAQAGRSSAAGRTALAWQLQELPDGLTTESPTCGRLLVLRYGYAYALREPCESGGTAEPVAEGWLTTAEITQFVEWLRDWTTVYDEGGYLDGQGEGTPDAKEMAALTEWIDAVFNRLAAQ